MISNVVGDCGFSAAESFSAVLHDGPPIIRRLHLEPIVAIKFRKIAFHTLTDVFKMNFNVSIAIRTGLFMIKTSSGVKRNYWNLVLSEKFTESSKKPE